MPAQLEVQKLDIAAQLAKRWENDTELIDEIDAAIRRGLRASKWRWDNGTKSEVNEDDTKGQIESAKLILAYGSGLPLQRSLSLAIAESSYGAMKDALRESPALLTALEREVDKAKWKTRNVKQVVAADTEAQSELPAE